MIKKLLPILFVLIITSCSKEVPEDQLVERDGLFYEVNSQKPFNGTLVSYHDNGQLKLRSNYKNGKLEGLSENFHDNGQLRSEGYFQDWKQIGSFKIFFDNGRLQWVLNYEDGQLIGLENYYRNGQLQIKTNIKNGKPEGPYEGYWDDGQPMLGKDLEHLKNSIRW
tara:strand:- start:444 stop:941 length:498 start_codon:yes stop_codon:yes gene_type:complete